MPDRGAASVMGENERQPARLAAGWWLREARRVSARNAVEIWGDGCRPIRTDLHR